MDIKYTNKTHGVTFGDLPLGALFRTIEEGGLFVKYKDHGAGQTWAVVIEPLDCRTPTEAGRVTPWDDLVCVIPVTHLAVTVG